MSKVKKEQTKEELKYELSLYKKEKKWYIIMGIVWMFLLLGLWIYPYRYEILYKLKLKEPPEINFQPNSNLSDMPKHITIDYGYFPFERLEIFNFTNCSWIPCPCQLDKETPYCLAYCVECGESSNESK